MPISLQVQVVAQDGRVCMNVFAMLLVAFSITGCSLDAKILGPFEEVAPAHEPSFKMQRAGTDFISGEIVTTGNGVIVRGTFGEISKKQTLSSGIVIEGAFYE